MRVFILAVFLIQCLGFLRAEFNLNFSKRDWVVDKGDHELVCSQEPIDFGIVLDSSSSIDEENFEKAKQFLVRFLDQFAIGDGDDDVRVSIITFGKGIYPKDGFNLGDHHNKADLFEAILAVKHRAGPYTATGDGIHYMHYTQFAPSKTRSHAQKICLVITDGNSQRWTTTKREAAAARNDNITMFALGVGRENQVGMRELLNIGGDEDHVTRVRDFDSLSAIREILAKKTCLKRVKATTTPVPMTESCGEVNPADIEFIFSPSDLGLDATAWANMFISNTVDTDDMKVGFQYGVMTGFCPLDAGFTLDKYDNTDDIKEHMSHYSTVKLPFLISNDLFSKERGGRADAKHVAVVFMSGTGQSKGREIEYRILDLVARGVEVFIANPAGYPVNIPGTKALSGRSSRRQSEQFISFLCPK